MATLIAVAEIRRVCSVLENVEDAVEAARVFRVPLGVGVVTCVLSQKVVVRLDAVTPLELEDVLGHSPLIMHHVPR